MTGYLFDKVSELKDRFKKFFIQKKKINALENYASVVPFHHRGYLNLIKKCMNEGFLDEPSANYLSHLVDKYFNDQNYLDWAHKTRWLKSEICRLSNAKPAAQMMLFDFEKKAPAFEVPLEVLSQHQRSGIGRRV